MGKRLKLIARRDVLRELRTEERYYRRKFESGAADERAEARADMLLSLIGEVKRMKVRGKIDR